MTPSKLITIFFLTSSFSYGTTQSDEKYLSTALLNSLDDWAQFKEFQEKFNKNYETLDELEKRFNIFQSNFFNIISHNSDSTQNFTMGVNQFTDLTSDEFRSKFIGGSDRHSVGTYGCGLFSSSDTSNIPLSIDWREKNAVTSVKDQGQCGSCWAFSSTGAVEGAWAISKEQLIDLSEQELVDCATGLAYGSDGCNGGQMNGGFKYVIENGQCLLSEYPYTSGVSQTGGKCQTCSAVVKLSSCSDVKSKDQISLKVAVAQQPIAVAIEADTRYFQSYSSGVLDASTCGTNLDHGVLIVGYGNQNGENYWLVKNSWSETWGEKGYVKILRSDSMNDSGICGIAIEPSFPSI